jgi:hypothetical protein
VSTTSSKSPQEVLEEVRRVCEKYGYSTKEKGFVIKAKSDNGKVAMNIEVCQLEQFDLRGVRTKRVKGDTWIYKEVGLGIVDSSRLCSHSSSFSLDVHPIGDRAATLNRLDDSQLCMHVDVLPAPVEVSKYLMPMMYM